MQRRTKRKRQKLVGRDKGSLTEQQKKENRNNNDTDKEKIGHRLAQQTLSPGQDQHRVLPSCERVPPLAVPPNGTQHDGTWYGIPGSVWPGGVSPHPPAVPLPGVR